MYAKLPATLLLALAACASAPAGDHPPALTAQVEWTNVCTDWDEWDKPAPPFRVFGNTWYVGTCGISAILITDPEGHILIDGGTETGAEHIAKNIAALGFDIRDVSLIAFSHEHFDHVGGIAKLQELSGASLVSSAAAAEVMRSGISANGDPQAGMHEPFKPARVDFIQGDGESIIVGKSVVISIATPGHTPGAMSWHWKSCEGEECRSIVYADSLSPISSDTYRFSDHPDYVAQFREGLARLAALDCDILLTPHPSASGMRDNILENGRIAENPSACRDYASSVSERLDARLAEEAS